MTTEKEKDHTKISAHKEKGKEEVVLSFSCCPMPVSFSPGYSPSSSIGSTGESTSYTPLMDKSDQHPAETVSATDTPPTSCECSTLHTPLDVHTPVCDEWSFMVPLICATASPSFAYLTEQQAHMDGIYDLDPGNQMQSSFLIPHVDDDPFFPIPHVVYDPLLLIPHVVDDPFFPIPDVLFQ
jgi:hypothetical protein